MTPEMIKRNIAVRIETGDPILGKTKNGKLISAGRNQTAVPTSKPYSVILCSVTKSLATASEAAHAFYMLASTADLEQFNYISLDQLPVVDRIIVRRPKVSA